MARPTKEQILDQIKTAVVDVVASRGIGATSVADIAKEAKVSAGTIYLHFENKDDMLQKVYLRLKREFHAALMAVTESEDPKATVKQMWLNLFEFMQSHPNDYLYLEYAGAAQVLNDAQRAEIAPLQDEVTALIRMAMAKAELSDVPLGVVENLLIGPAMHLARKSVLSRIAPTKAEIDQTFERVWAGLQI